MRPNIFFGLECFWLQPFGGFFTKSVYAATSSLVVVIDSILCDARMKASTLASTLAPPARKVTTGCMSQMPIDQLLVSISWSHNNLTTTQVLCLIVSMLALGYKLLLSYIKFCLLQTLETLSSSGEVSDFLAVGHRTSLKLRLIVASENRPPNIISENVFFYGSLQRSKRIRQVSCYRPVDQEDFGFSRKGRTKSIRAS